MRTTKNDHRGECVRMARRAANTAFCSAPGCGRNKTVPSREAPWTLRGLPVSACKSQRGKRAPRLTVALPHGSRLPHIGVPFRSVRKL